MKKKGPLFLITAFFLLFASCTADNKNTITETSDTGIKVAKKSTGTPAKKNRKTDKKLKKASLSLSKRAHQMADYAEAKGYSGKYCFLIDMSLPSGKNRFFVYDLEKGMVAYTGLVAHGSCEERFLSRAKFSNVANSGCSSLGRYKVGIFYNGKYGKSFKLHGLDNSNSNAFSRGVVIHGYDCVPDEEIFPRVLCNSLGCPMVSYNFFDRLSRIIQRSDKPILLWIYR